MGYDFKNKLFDFDMVLVWSASHSQTSQVINFKCWFYGSCTTFDSMTGFFLKVCDTSLRMSYVVVFVGVLSILKFAFRHLPNCSTSMKWQGSSILAFFLQVVKRGMSQRSNLPPPVI